MFVTSYSTDDIEASELANAAPSAGDEGVLEEVVKMGINNAAAVLKHADLQDVVKEGSKLVAKTVRACLLCVHVSKYAFVC